MNVAWEKGVKMWRQTERQGLLKCEQYECQYRLRYEERSPFKIVRLNEVTVLKSTSVGRPLHALTTRSLKKELRMPTCFKQFIIPSPGVYSKTDINTVTETFLDTTRSVRLEIILKHFASVLFTV